MVFRKESILERLKKLETVIENLQDKPVDNLEQYKSDLDLQWIVERGLEVASSVIFDAGNHILAGHYKISVDEYEQILQQPSVYYSPFIKRAEYNSFRWTLLWKSLLLPGCEI